MVLLKRSCMQKVVPRVLHLHSNMVLLKPSLCVLVPSYNFYLHSNMVLLKPACNTMIALVTTPFTFQYGAT